MTVAGSRLLLVGGGHAHVEVVRRLGGLAKTGAEVLLLDPSQHAAYSGMLPGLIAGHYTFRQAHIDLPRLCTAHGVRFARRRLQALDLRRRILTDEKGAEWQYDLLSIDTGSTPPLPSTDRNPGKGDALVGVKPVPRMLEAWQRFLEESRDRTGHRQVVVIGGGPAGVELALAMRHRLDVEDTKRVEVLLVSEALLAGFPRRARVSGERALERAGVPLILDRAIETRGRDLVLRRGGALSIDLAVWASGARAPEWSAASGLACDERGFIAIDQRLRSVSHDEVFAAGDVSSLQSSPAPRSGVTAVRQGPVLAENLARALRGDPPTKRYRPQRASLALISLGGRRAIATRGRWSASGRWAWWWKDRIDRGFVDRYSTD